ncbi:MAG TPA: thiamine phosphate synthase [Edaphobacter sp.]|nr:thiamine phosphate synthase [Edaphobacter sp.]
MTLPRLYPILDIDVLTARGIALDSAARALRDASTTLLQYRNKSGSPQAILRDAEVIRNAFAGVDCRLIMNDRADLAVLAGFGGIHVGQDDLSPADSRRIVGTDRWVGVSTHNDAQVLLADQTDADYIAVGPVFATGTKLDAEPVIGLEGVRRARTLTAKPVVAIGGITRANARSVIEAGADSVAVISALLEAGQPLEKLVRDFLKNLG